MLLAHLLNNFFILKNVKIRQDNGIYTVLNVSRLYLQPRRIAQEFTGHPSNGTSRLAIEIRTLSIEQILRFDLAY